MEIQLRKFYKHKEYNSFCNPISFTSFEYDKGGRYDGPGFYTNENGASRIGDMDILSEHQSGYEEITREQFYEEFLKVSKIIGDKFIAATKSK